MMTSHVLFVHLAVSRLQVPEMDVLVLKAMQDLGVHPNLLAVSLGPLFLTLLGHSGAHQMSPCRGREREREKVTKLDGTAFLKDVLVLLVRIPAFHFSWKIAF
jgi:hypothetical protein